jgi:hypothetical protein
MSSNDKSKVFISTKMTISDMEYKSMNTKKGCMTNSDCKTKAEFCNNKQCFVKFWRAKEQAQKENLNVKLDDRLLIWIKPLDYCTELSNIHANTIITYPNKGFNTFNFEQLFEGFKTTPSQGHVVISAKTVKHYGLFCETTVAFNYANDFTTYQ